MGRRATAGLVLAVGSVLAGCGAQAASDGPAATEPTVSPSAAPSTVLAALRPCALLSPSDRSTAGLTSLGKDKTIGTARACDWTETGTFGLTITLDDTAALADLNTAGGKPVTVGRHHGVRVGSTGGCGVLLAAGDRATAQVDVTNASFTGSAAACDKATTVAGLIEPKLP
ncbi:MAG TPA: DUF3558 family protein [Amycolatopsis sp.]|nr:DUF3558 family protein [Amycolatopsis sp.]